MVNIEKLQEKLGEAMGLEMAPQKAVDELGSKGLLDENSRIIDLRKICVGKLDFGMEYHDWV
jgi:hypothetical protein